MLVMLTIMIILLSTMTLTSIIMLIASTLSKKALWDREKCSPFECGFDPYSSSRLPFSLRFFLIAIIFLVFDVEIALLLPMLVTMNSTNLMAWTFTSLLFIIILLVGLYHEWNQGALNWTT